MSARLARLGIAPTDDVVEQVGHYLAAEPDATDAQLREAVDEYLARDELDPMPADLPDKILERLDRQRPFA